MSRTISLRLLLGIPSVLQTSVSHIRTSPLLSKSLDDPEKGGTGTEQVQRRKKSDRTRPASIVCGNPSREKW